MRFYPRFPSSFESFQTEDVFHVLSRFSFNMLNEKSTLCEACESMHLNEVLLGFKISNKKVCFMQNYERELTHP